MMRMAVLIVVLLTDRRMNVGPLREVRMSSDEEAYADRVTSRVA